MTYIDNVYAEFGCLSKTLIDKIMRDEDTQVVSILSVKNDNRDVIITCVNDTALGGESHEYEVTLSIGREDALMLAQLLQAAASRI